MTVSGYVSRQFAVVAESMAEVESPCPVVVSTLRHVSPVLNQPVPPFAKLPFCTGASELTGARTLPLGPATTVN